MRHLDAACSSSAGYLPSGSKRKNALPAPLRQFLCSSSVPFDRYCFLGFIWPCSRASFLQLPGHDGGIVALSIPQLIPGSSTTFTLRPH